MHMLLDRPSCPSSPSPTHVAQVYVIGGLVDRTVQKGASLRLAQQCGARAVRLPIPEHLGGALHKGKGVLNVNDVFAILLSVHAGQGWKEALEAAIPQRFRQPQQGKQQGKKGQRQAAAVEEEQQRGGSAEAATAAAAEEHAEEQQQAAAAGGTAAPAEKARLF